MLLFFLSPKCILSHESSIDINDATTYEFPYRLGKDYEKISNSKFTRNGKPISGAEGKPEFDEGQRQYVGKQTLDLEVYTAPTDVEHPWGHPKHFFEALNDIVDEKKLDAFIKDIKDNEEEPISKPERRAFFEQSVKPKLLTELKKTKCFFKRTSQYDLGEIEKIDCTKQTAAKCEDYSNLCEPNEIMDITLLGDSLEKHLKPGGLRADKLKKVNDAIQDKDGDIEELKTKYRKAVVWSDEWFRAGNGFSSNSGWFINRKSRAPSADEDISRIADETKKYLSEDKDVKLTTSKLMQGLPEIHLDTFVVPLKDYIEHGYGAELDDGFYQGHTLNFWMPLWDMMAAPLGFVTNDQTKFEVGSFKKRGSGWLFDTEFKKHTMISAITAKTANQVEGNNKRQSLEFRFDLHFKTKPTERDEPRGLLLKESRQSFLAPDSE